MNRVKEHMILPDRPPANEEVLEYLRRLHTAIRERDAELSRAINEMVDYINALP